MKRIHLPCKQYHMHLTKHAAAFGKNVHLGFQPLFLFQICCQKYAKTVTFRKSVLWQLPMEAIQHDSMNDMKSLAKKKPGIFQPSASTRPLAVRNSPSPNEILKTQLNAKAINSSSPRQDSLFCMAGSPSQGPSLKC